MTIPVEQLSWPDKGCALHPACLTCPEPVCVFDLPVRHNRKRRAEGVELSARGATAQEIADALGVTRRTAKRYVAEGRAG